MGAVLARMTKTPTRVSSTGIQDINDSRQPVPMLQHGKPCYRTQDAYAERKNCQGSQAGFLSTKNYNYVNSIN